MFESSKIANAFLTESKLDLQSAKLLFEKGIYSRAVYFAHQSSEKAIKSIQGIKSRYPLFSRPDKPIWIPSEEYIEEDAGEAIRKASFILNSLTQFIVSNMGNLSDE